MSRNTLFMGWKTPRQGRESTASELFNAVMGYLANKQKAGTIDSFEPVILDPHGGDMNGFILVRGDHKKLNAMREDEEFLNLVTQCTMNVDGFGTVAGWSGDAIQSQMTRWRKYIGK